MPKETTKTEFEYNSNDIREMIAANYQKQNVAVKKGDIIFKGENENIIVTGIGVKNIKQRKKKESVRQASE